MTLRTIPLWRSVAPRPESLVAAMPLTVRGGRAFNRSRGSRNRLFARFARRWCRNPLFAGSLRAMSARAIAARSPSAIAVRTRTFTVLRPAARPPDLDHRNIGFWRRGRPGGGFTPGRGGGVRLCFLIGRGGANRLSTTGGSLLGFRRFFARDLDRSFNHRRDRIDRRLVRPGASGSPGFNNGLVTSRGGLF